MFILILKIVAYIIGGLFLFLIVGLVLTHISHVRNRNRRHVCRCGTSYRQAQAEEAMFQRLNEEYGVEKGQIMELWSALYDSDLGDFFHALASREWEDMFKFILDNFLEKGSDGINIINIEKALGSGRDILEAELRKGFSEYTLGQLDQRNNKS